MKIVLIFLISAFCLLAEAQSSLNVTNYGAVPDAVQFSCNTVSNSSIVQAVGQTFDSSAIGKVCEVFGAAPWTYINPTPANGQIVFTNNGSVFSTNTDTICLITNVTQGTNLWLSIPQGWTKSTTAIVGTNNAVQIQNCINAADALIDAGSNNITINIPDGTYLCIAAHELDANEIQTDIAEADQAMTIDHGGITFLGQSTNAVIMGCGAGMEHLLWNSFDANNTWPYGTAGCYVPPRGILFKCYGNSDTGIIHNELPLVFENLTMDGGTLNGTTPYTYWILHQGNGDGWDTTHHAVADSNPFGGLGDPRDQMHQLKVFTNCVFQHWRGENLISFVGTGGTNCFIDIANCTFFDSNGTADNMYFGQHVHGCTFNQMGKLAEIYQSHATLPVLWENNVASNISGNMFSVVGSVTNFTSYPITLQNNVFYGSPGVGTVTIAPAENLSIISNDFYGTASSGVVFTGAGLQPSDGTATVISNILIAGNNFHDTATPITIGFYGVYDLLITNNTGGGGSGQVFFGASGWMTNVVLANNTSSLWIDISGVAGGNYPLDETNNSFGVQYGQGDQDYSGITKTITYQLGWFHPINHAVSGTAYYLDDTSPGFMPSGAIIGVSNRTDNADTFPVYLSQANPTASVSLAPSAQMLFYWDDDAGAWQTNAPGGGGGLGGPAPGNPTIYFDHAQIIAPKFLIR